MKLLVFLFLTPSALLMTKDQSDRLEYLSKPCQIATGVPPEMVQQTRQGIWDPDYRMKNNTFCVGKRVGVVWNNGKLIFPALRQRALVATDSVEEGEAAVKTCCSKHYRTPEDSAFYCISCLFKSLPLYSNT